MLLERASSTPGQAQAGSVWLGSGVLISCMSRVHDSRLLCAWRAHGARLSRCPMVPEHARTVVRACFAPCARLDVIILCWLLIAINCCHSYVVLVLCMYSVA